MRTKYSREQKIAAVGRLERGEPDGLNLKMVRRWRDEWYKYGANAFTGYGKSRTPKVQKTEAIIFRLTAAEYSRLLLCVQQSGARTLSQFAREQLFRTEPAAGDLEHRIAQATRALATLAASGSAVRTTRSSGR